MNTGIVLSILIVALFAVKALFGRVRASLEAKKQALLNVALSKGWRCEPQGVTGFYTMSGTTEGVTWQLEAGREGKSSKSPVSTRWTSADVAFDNIVLAIRTRKTYDLLQGRFGQLLLTLAKTASQKTNAVQVADASLLRQGKRVTPSSSTVDSKYAVVITSESNLEEVLSADLERALADWAGVPTRGSYGDTFGVDVGPKARVYCSFIVEPKYLEQFVNLGAQVVNAVKSATASASTHKSRI